MSLQMLKEFQAISLHSTQGHQLVTIVTRQPLGVYRPHPPPIGGDAGPPAPPLKPPILRLGPPPPSGPDL